MELGKDAIIASLHGIEKRREVSRLYMELEKDAKYRVCTGNKKDASIASLHLGDLNAD